MARRDKKRKTRKGKKVYRGRGGGFLDFFGLGKPSKVAPMDSGVPAVESKNMSKTLSEKQNIKPTILVKTENNENPQPLESIIKNNGVSTPLRGVDPRTPIPNTPLTPRRISAKRVNLRPRTISAEILVNNRKQNQGSVATNLKPVGSVLNIQKVNNARRTTNIYNARRNKRVSTEYIKRNPNNNRKTLKKINRENIGNNMSITPIKNFI